MDTLEKREQARKRAELIRCLNRLLPQEEGVLAVVPAYNGALDISTATLEHIVACVVGEGI